MIRSFRGRLAEQIFNRMHAVRLGADVQRAAYRKLVALHLADDLHELRFPPGNRLEKLSGDGAGLHSLRINDQWRIVFRWSARGADDVEIVDYH